MGWEIGNGTRERITDRYIDKTFSINKQKNKALIRWEHGCQKV